MKLDLCRPPRAVAARLPAWIRIAAAHASVPASWLALALAISIFPAASPAVQAADPEPLKVLLITGGCCHDYTAQKTILAEGLEARAHVKVTVVQQGGSTTDTKIELYENADWAKGYDVVIHDECFAAVKDNAWTQRILKPHQEGIPAVVLHCAMHCYRDGTDDWFKFCGVTSRRHGAHYPHEVLNADAEHPIMKTFPAAWANPAGELYWIEKVWDTAHPLGTSKNREKGNTEVCVWTNTYGEKTRVFGTTLGHHNETVKHPVYLDLVTRGTLWAADKLKDEYLKQPQAQLIPENLSIGKTASASSEETRKGNVAKLAIDGDASTRWCASSAALPQSLTIDLEKPQAIHGCKLSWESGGNYQYLIEGSADGQTWKPLFDARQAKTRVDTHKFEAADVRFLKVTCTGTAGGWASLWEVEIFGDKVIEIPPGAPLAKIPGEEAILKEVKVPAGFEANVFAVPPAALYPVFVAAAPNGDLYVAVDKNGSLDRKPFHGAIHRLRDLDHDGRADEVSMFVPNVDSPRGLVVDHDRVYCLHPPHLSAFIDKDGDGAADEEQILVKNIAFTFKDRPADHTSNGVTLGIDGWLYLAIGDFGFMEAEGADGTKLQLRAGGVVRVRPDGTGLELYARGTRNILEVGVDPLLNGFTRDNTNDGGGWDVRLHHFSGLEEHGYPSFYKNFADEHVQPLADYGGGSGCGGLYLDEPGFPDGFGNAMYTADWGRSIVYRHRLAANGATYKDEQHEFVSLPRVTDLDVDANSTLYLASWKGATFTYVGDEVGYVIRVVPKGYEPLPLPDFAKATDAELVAFLHSPSHRRRLEAQRTLLRRPSAAQQAPALVALAANGEASLASRVAAIFTLKQALGAKSHPELVKLASDAAIRPFVVRALGDRADQTEGVPAELLTQAVNDPHPRTRLEAAVAIARLERRELAGAVTKLFADSDPLVRHTAERALALISASEACFAVVDDAQASPEQRASAIRVLQRLHDPAVVSGLATRLAAESDLSKRQGLLIALCRLHAQEGKWTGNSWGTRPDTSGPYYQPEPWAESERIVALLKTTLAAASSAETAFLFEQFARHKITIDEGLEKLLAMATTDAKLLPAAVAQLARAKSVPAAGVPVLASAAMAEGLPSAIRGQATTALFKSATEAAFPAGFAGLVKLLATAEKTPEFNQAREAFLQPALLEKQLDFLKTEAAKLDGASSKLAEAGLVVLAAKKDTPAEPKAVAQQTLDSAWTDPKRRAQILEAALLANEHSYENKALALVTDPDAAVAAIAKRIVKQWKLDEDAPSTGPKLATMKPEDVIVLVEKMKGNANRGERIFIKLACAKCHTSLVGEPLRGPFLPAVAKLYKRNQLAESILQPSKSVAQGFVTNVFELDDGRVVMGFVTDEAADTVTIRDNEGREIKLDAKSIENRDKHKLSMMPEGLAKDLTLEEFAHLMAYLESLAALAK